MTNQNVTMWAGDSLNINATVTDQSGAAADLTGAQAIEWVMQYNVSSTSQLAKKTLGNGVTVTNAAGGVFQVALVPTDTQSLNGNYYHQAKVTDAVGDVSVVTVGMVTVNPSAP